MTSRIFLIQEIQDEKYELLFGDGFIGKKLENGQVITVNYITTDGPDGNGVNEFAFSGTLVDNTDNQNIISLNTASVTRISSSQNGSDSENIDSIKYFCSKNIFFTI